MMMAAAAYTDLPWRERACTCQVLGLRARHPLVANRHADRDHRHQQRACHSVLKQGLDHDLEGHFIRRGCLSLAKVPRPSSTNRGR